MLNNRSLLLSSKRVNCYFWIFISIHTILWTIGFSLLRPSLPHDTLEGITWGLQWQLGYNKHPFLTAWFCAATTQLFGTVGWPIYLLAQIAVSTTFFAVWRLAQKIVPPVHALISCLLLEGVCFYNINSGIVTPDTLQVPLWALLSLFFYQAIITQKLSHWLFSALFAALCICTKYQAVLLFLPLFFLCLWNGQARLSFKKPGIYSALIVFFLLITPHLIWLYQHNFITLTYAKEISSEYTQDKNHITYPLRFFVNNLLDVLGLFLLLWPFYNERKMPLHLSSFQWQFLISIVLGPLAISLVCCFVSGDYFPPRWSTPYFFALGILAIAYLKPVMSLTSLKRFSITFVLFSSLLLILKMSAMNWKARPESDAFLPNKHIALSLSKLWHEHYQTPLPFIAGSNYLVAMITPYMHDKPSPYLSWDVDESPWINENELHEKGGLFVWDEGQHFAWDKDSKNHALLPPSVLARFPKLKVLTPITFYRLSDKSPIIIGVAILPPEIKK